MLQYWLYLKFCLLGPISQLDCRPVWETVMYVSFCLGIGLLLWVVACYLDYQTKLAAALQAELRRQFVDKEAIAARRWTGDDYYEAGEPAQAGTSAAAANHHPG